MGVLEVEFEMNPLVRRRVVMDVESRVAPREGRWEEEEEEGRRRRSVRKELMDLVEKAKGKLGMTREKESERESRHEQTDTAAETITEERFENRNQRLRNTQRAKDEIVQERTETQKRAGSRVVPVEYIDKGHIGALDDTDRRFA